jgi:hypothetical protein
VACLKLTVRGGEADSLSSPPPQPARTSATTVAIQRDLLLVLLPIR